MISPSSLPLPSLSLPLPLPLPCLLRPRPRPHLHPYPANADRGSKRRNSHDAGLRLATKEALATFGGLHGDGSTTGCPVCGLLLTHTYASAPGGSQESPGPCRRTEIRDGK